MSKSASMCSFASKLSLQTYANTWAVMVITNARTFVFSKLTCFKFVMICALLLSSQITKASFEVSELYIEAQGNNAYEAKTKAHHQGMLRAFLMTADRLGISASDIALVPYLRLKDAFKINSTNKVVESNTLYKTTVTYDYELYDVNKLLLDYGNDTVKNKFYEYLVLPVFKQKNIFTLWNSKQEWNKKWSNSRLILDQAKLFYPKPSTQLIQNITPENLLTLTYKDYLDLFPSMLIKKVMIIICEYFTNIRTGAAVMEVKYVIIDNDGRTIIEKQYPLSSMNDALKEVTTVFLETVEHYGRFENEDDKVNLLSSNLNRPKSVIIQPKLIDDDVRTVIFTLEAFSDAELARIKEKLQTVACIEHWSIEHDYNEKYKVTILTKYDDAKLAESLYLSKLSFRMYGDVYSLIDVINDGT